MSRRGGGFGMVILVIVLAVVLLLVAKSWRAFGPAATAVTQPRVTDPAFTESPGELPDLQETQDRTDEHKRQVKSALDEIE